MKSAIGKFKTEVCNHLDIRFSIPLNPKSILPKKLIIGHIKHTIILDIASVITIGLSVFGSTILNAIFFANFPNKEKL